MNSNMEKPYVVGIDIGGTNTVFGIVDARGTIIASSSIKTGAYEDYIAIGNKDFLFQANNDYRKMLDEKGYKYEYYETGEGHIWKNWRIYLTEFAPKIFK